MKTLQIGDKVAYSVQWLKSVGQPHSDLARARGVITGIQTVGTSLKLALINWQDEDIPAKVNVANLAHVGPNTRFANC